MNYKVCGVVMIACLVSILIYFSLFDFDHSQSCYVFRVESFALIAFGVSWLIKGGALYPDTEIQGF